MMKNRDVKSVFKKMLVSSLVMMTVLTSVSITSKAADDKTVIYEKMSMTGYYDQSEKKAPTRAGYVFAGWYTDEGKTVATETKEDAYAKFVPTEVLSVKTQVNKTEVEEKNLDAVNSGQTLRVVSAVDSTRYQKVGFKYILGAKGTEKKNCESTEVYKKLLVVGKDGGTDEKTAAEYFGESAQWFFAMNITEISSTHYSSQIYVQPYWVTLDGTTVYGQASNVFLEDHCADKNYYRASVNLFGGQDIAAGKVSVKYDSDSFEFVDVKVGRMFKNEIESNAGNGTVTIVGNASTVNTHEQAGDLLMTVRFTKKANADATSVSFTDFTSQFCDWNEKDVTGIVVQ